MQKQRKDKVNEYEIYKVSEYKIYKVSESKIYKVSESFSSLLVVFV